MSNEKENTSNRGTIPMIIMGIVLVLCVIAVLYSNYHCEKKAEGESVSQDPRIVPADTAAIAEAERLAREVQINEEAKVAELQAQLDRESKAREAAEAELLKLEGKMGELQNNASSFEQKKLALEKQMQTEADGEYKNILARIDKTREELENLERKQQSARAARDEAYRRQSAIKERLDQLLIYSRNYKRMDSVLFQNHK
jgi:chromosome segregation ATPase